MTSDTVVVPVSLMIFLGGIIVSSITFILSFAVHLLIAIRSSLGKLVTEMAVRATEINGRLAVLERHDTANEEERRHAQHHFAFAGGINESR